MKVLLVDVDGTKFPNFALEKIRKFHLDKGDEIIQDFWAFDPPDKTYVSCVFGWNKERCEKWEGKAIIGGSGYNIRSRLPADIEKEKPKVNFGFTTRGCIRNCSFCLVPQMEGKIRVVGDLLDLWDGRSKEITIMDNNILALPKHFTLICKQARENDIRVDFNQGLDHRLLSQGIVDELKGIKHRMEYRFAFDHPSLLPSVQKAIDLFQRNGIMKCMWYVLVGFDTSWEEDLFRLKYLRDRGQIVYVQRYRYREKNPFYIALAKWGNQRWIFRGMPWKQFINRPELEKHKKWIVENFLLKRRKRKDEITS